MVGHYPIMQVPWNIPGYSWLPLWLSAIGWYAIRRNHPAEMHELSIVMSILDIANNTVELHHAKEVEVIELDIGEIAGIEMPALDFAWQAAIPGTVLQKAERQINHIPGIGKCLECGATFPMPNLYTPCPECNSYFTDVIAGKELKIKSLTLATAED